MYSFKEFLFETSGVEVIPGRLGQPAKIYINPSRQGMKMLAGEMKTNKYNPSGIFRTVRHGDDYYACDGSLATHDTIAHNFGLTHTPETPLQGSMYRGDHLAASDFDVKALHKKYHCKVEFERQTGYTPAPGIPDNGFKE